ncbi:P-loop containing nucleoside triphosphate hydrolase protein [Apiosordaria backusii]|uniref:P-loop containing nucleoside triphosphate hydrolase protein n=1 Tax=Apiosordaria backusii TaxID=314023 RepID=A0AA40K3H0_9PEZI|nr:P-loop containing nucleoside triphosphate hydrolase protein [Apiosordaria backusii]
MVDYQVYSKFHGNADAFRFSEKDIANFDKWPKTQSHKTSLSKEDLILLPQGIHGFYLKEKKWIHLFVDKIQPVSWNKAAFDQLVLPKRTKNIIKALVMVRRQTLQNSGLQIGLKGGRDDIIAGKGSGLIMLLHGGPGTGKTLTAESVAELAEMPLYSVTCGDIGTSPEAVEKYLNSVLHLGKKWNCVLLLDEADVFLEERTLQDLERNSLVSVFLRTLEYYDGVLILTSNRVGTFDEAFKSRIQLALHYPPLDAPSRRKIWHNFLNMLSANDEKADIDDIKAHMDQFAGYELNGRQIRNALTTARQLALFEQETLDWDRVKDSIEVSADFTRYIKEVHGHTDEEWSRDNNLR